MLSKKLCSPAFFYFFVSILSFLIIYIQNTGNSDKLFCLGMYDCPVENKFYIYFFELVYIFLWTFILNSLCQKGYKDISWFLVLLPYLFMFILIGIFMIKTI